MSFISLSGEAFGLAKDAVSLSVVSFESCKFSIDFFTVFQSLSLGMNLTILLLLQAKKKTLKN